MRLWIAAVAVVSIMAPCVGHAGVPMTCRVEAQSDAGGRVTLSTFDPSPKLPFQMPPSLGWRPPSTADAIEMAVGGHGGQSLGDLTGGHVMFTPKVIAGAAHYTARVTAGTGKAWTYGPGDLEFGREKADFGINADDPRGSGVLAAIGHGTRLKVDILFDGKIEQSDTFDPSNVTERDKLVAYARHLVETRDPRVCKPI